MALAQTTNTAIVIGQYQSNSAATYYISDQVVGFTIGGLKPSTRISVFFDGTNVTSLCAPATYSSTLATVSSNDYKAVGAKGTALVSDSTGGFKGIFYLPKSTYQTGTREFHVFDYTSDSDTYDAKVASHSCEAFAYYMAFNAGITDNDNAAIISTIPAGSTSSVTLSNRGSGTPTSVDPNAPRFDPMCQTFYIGSDMSKGQDGIYIAALDLYFSAASVNQPITVDIRTVENGLPTTTIMPYSQVTVPAQSVNVDATGRTATTFTFNSPIYLRSGYTYAIGVMAGGQVPDYQIWTSIVGNTDAINGVADSSWGTGTLYTSSTGTVWTPLQNHALKFTLHKVAFSVLSGTASFVNLDYEFLTFSNSSVTPFVVGEYLYQMPHPYPGYVSVNTTSNTISYNANVSNSLFCNVASEFAVNDYILIVGSIPAGNDPSQLNYGIFSNAFTAMVTAVSPSNNSVQFAYANGSGSSGAPFANSASIFYKPAKGTVSISAGSQAVQGTGTRFDQQFNANNPLVVRWSNSSASGHEVLWPQTISNSTYMTTLNSPLTSNVSAIPLTVPIGRVSAIDYNRNLIILDRSTANNSSNNNAWANIFASPSYFSSSRVVVGSTSGATALISKVVNIPLNSVQPIVYQTSVQGTSVTYSANVTTSNYTPSSILSLSTSDTNYLTNAEIIIASKSNEINYNNGNKSLTLNAALSSNSDTLSPSIDNAHMTMLVKTNVVGPDASGEYGSSGTALSKYVSVPIVLGDGNDAEDLTVYLTAYRPPNTDIKVYARLLSASDSDNLSDKSWTELIPASPTLYSDSVNQTDYKEFEFDLPIDPATLVDTDLVTTNNSVSISSTTGNTSWTSQFSNNQLITIYSDSSLTNYEVHTISAVSDTSITLNSSVGLSNTTSALIGTMIYPNAGYKNSLNHNIIRYYNENGVPYDSYLQYSIKVVLLADQSHLVPKLQNIRALALSV